LSFNADENDIGNFLEEKFGTISRVNLLKNEDGRSKGIAFITFETEEGCNKAVAGSGIELLGRQILIEKTKPKGERPAHLPVDEESKTIFVGNLSFQCEAETLKKFFASCGNVLDARIAQADGKVKNKNILNLSNSYSLYFILLFLPYFVSTNFRAEALDMLSSLIRAVLRMPLRRQVRPSKVDPLKLTLLLLEANVKVSTNLVSVATVLVVSVVTVVVLVVLPETTPPQMREEELLPNSKVKLSLSEQYISDIIIFLKI